MKMLHVHLKSENIPMCTCFKGFRAQGIFKHLLKEKTTDIK